MNTFYKKASVFMPVIIKYTKRIVYIPTLSLGGGEGGMVSSKAGGSGEPMGGQNINHCHAVNWFINSWT